MTEAAGRRVADSTGNWVDRLAPVWSRPYLRLARFDRPIGSWLLLIPCWWSSALAAISAQEPGQHRAAHLDLANLNLLHLALFFAGAFAMRGAGCTWNDIVDRDLDRGVERTRSRPIPSGQVRVAQAALFLVVLAIVVVYPFMKRITYWPQIVLGLAFSWGALVGWAAALGRLDAASLVLYAGTIAWVIGYDTIYAHQDREDDALIGVKSTALLFGERTRPMLVIFYGLAVALIALAGALCGAGMLFWLGLAAFAAQLCWQIARLDIRDPALCLALFKSNRDAGLMLFAGMTAAALWRG
jgi:4-hydroxybenzoate polyprenyltransferase